jgi:hypothetical protein
MKRAYILTNFSTYLKSYSPIIVVQAQLEMLMSHGYQPTLIACEGWNPPEGSVYSRVETKKLTQVPVSNTPGVDATFDADIETLHSELTSFIEDGSVVLTHDLIFLPDYTKLHVAARRFAVEHPSVSWVHMIHSATSPRGLIAEREMYGETYKELLGSKFPNSVIAFPNAYDIPRVARNFSFEEDEIHEVPHASDVSEGMERIVRDIYVNQKLYEPEIFMVFPLRLDRGKNAEMNVQLTAALKRIGTSVKMLFCDFQSTGDDKVVYRRELRALAESLDVKDEVMFLSELDASAHLEVSHKAVLDFLTISNVFMLPSKSETYSLVAQEAMAKGNLCILNHDFAPMRQIYGDNAIYRQFSSNIGMDGLNGEIVTTYSPDIESYFDDLARAVKYYLSRDKAVKGKTWVRTKRNHSYIFKNHLEPLLGDLREDS